VRQYLKENPALVAELRRKILEARGFAPPEEAQQAAEEKVEKVE